VSEVKWHADDAVAASWPVIVDRREIRRNIGASARPVARNALSLAPAGTMLHSGGSSLRLAVQ